MKTCAKCVMDETDLDIIFDGRGICNHCLNFEAQKKTVAGTLELHIEKIKKEGKGKKYDCLIGLSGGVDSSMLAVKVKELGLRSIAVVFDNGWGMPAADKNIAALIKKLELDAEYHGFIYPVNEVADVCKVKKIDYEKQAQEYKDLQLAFLKAGAVNAEIPTDHILWAIMWQTAARYKVKTIVIGGNINSEGIMPEAWSYDAKDLVFIESVLGRKLRYVPHMSLPEYLYLRFIKKIKTFNLLDWIDYDKAKAAEELKAKFGWSDYGQKHCENFFTAFYQNYYLPKKFGIDKRKAFYSSLICAGQMARSEAVELLKEPPKFESKTWEVMALTLSRLGIDKRDLEKIIANPPTTGFKTGKNQWRFLQNLWKLKKKFAN